jgi:hypothetical protein
VKRKISEHFQRTATKQKSVLTVEVVDQAMLILSLATAYIMLYLYMGFISIHVSNPMTTGSLRIPNISDRCWEACHFVSDAQFIALIEGVDQSITWRILRRTAYTLLENVTCIRITFMAIFDSPVITIIGIALAQGYLWSIYSPLPCLWQYVFSFLF